MKLLRFENRHKPIASLRVFYLRMLRSVLTGAITIALALFIGMAGYHLSENMPWTDAFLNASMILSGMGPVTELHTNAGKIFAGSYALFSGLAFIMIVSLIFAPLLHRMFHLFHLEQDKE